MAFSVLRPFVVVASVAGFGAIASVSPGQHLTNLDDAKQTIIRYDSGRWSLDISRVVHQAEDWLVRCSRERGQLALVLDIDETALSNWPEEKATDFGYIPDLWSKWDAAAKTPAAPEIMELFHCAKKHGITIFFVTGRPEQERAATEENLKYVGYTGYRQLFIKPASYHTER